MKIACNAGNEKCLKDTYDLNQMLTDHNQKVPLGLESVVFCSGFRGTNKAEDWTNMFKKLEETTDATLRTQIINGLGCSDDAEVLQDYLETTVGVGSEKYTQAEKRAVISAVLNSYSGLQAVIEFFTTFELDILREFGYSDLQALVSVPARTVKTTAQQTLFSDYLATLTNLEADALRSITTIVTNNLEAQQTTLNAQMMGIIQKIVGTEEIENQLRLPKFQVPQLYKIHIRATEIPSGSKDFSGEIEIDVLIKETTSYVIMHSTNQDIEEIQVTDNASGNPVQVREHHLYPAAYTLTIYFAEDIAAETELLINIKYSSTMLLSSNGYGFYQTSYDIDGETRYLGATNFESSVSTRFAFPHFDEPWFKTVFQLTITHNRQHHAISNTLGTPTEK